MNNVSTLVAVFDKNMENLLFCRRTKNPYKGKLNFVGGKKNYCEHDIHCAYREFREETGIMSNHINMVKIMNINYSFPSLALAVFSCVLDSHADDIELKEEMNPLVWIPVHGTNFFDTDKFAGDGNIGLIVNESLKYWKADK